MAASSTASDSEICAMRVEGSYLIQLVDSDLDYPKQVEDDGAPKWERQWKTEMFSAVETEQFFEKTD